mmetsp:Transcript_25538/g.43599  ORF Transcript_25538/g.43599 Transcript_25538/m.43599 type:complete len:533 (+) Transcript_25538:139-1737(+)
MAASSLSIPQNSKGKGGDGLAAACAPLQVATSGSAPAPTPEDVRHPSHPSPSSQVEQHKKELHIAPMLNYSTREFRQLLRILSRRAVLWTEMVVDETVAHVSNLDEHLGFEPNTHPIVCQIGGNSPELCGGATSVVLEKYGYDECNLNIDCPSERVSGKREFGAVLMKKAELAKEIVKEMQNKANIPANGTSSNNNKVSIKCRIGVDDLDDLEFAAQFIETLQPVCKRFYLHARKCVLNGLMNARQNRSVPPLNYPRVYDLCRMFPDCDFWINGGIKKLEDARHIAYGTRVTAFSEDEENDAKKCDAQNLHQVPCQLCSIPNGSCIEPPTVAPSNLRGVMMGRAAIDDPCLFHDVDRYFFNEDTNPCKNRREVLERYCEYLERIYPRRCCDEDPRNSFEHPLPEVVMLRDYCEQCVDVYGPDLDRSDILACSHWSGLSKNNYSEQSLGATTKDKKTKDKHKVKPKIASKIIARSLKPVQGIFNGVPNSRSFRRCCDELGQNVTVRNCGPAYILRKAMQSVPLNVLDLEFKTS